MAFTLDLASDAEFTGHLAETFAKDRLCWTGALGWLEWDGQRWATSSAEAVIEQLRTWALKRHTDIRVSALAWLAEEGMTPAEIEDVRMRNLKQSTKTLGKRWLTDMEKLLRGAVETDASEFDANPNLLNTPSGVVNLRTGVTADHDPALLMRRMTRGSYLPGFSHPDWNAALSALPEDKRAFYGARVGKALLGQPGDSILIMRGDGSNGKGALGTGGLIPALGDYGHVASAKLLQGAANGGHSTETADLQGRRLVLCEELTEDRVLDVTTIKRITDVEHITARRLYKDNTTFAATHTLFATTNYDPVVKETDLGTWRRLAFLVFPHEFVNGQAELKAWQRRGDDGLKTRLKTGQQGQHDAAVTWAVDWALQVAQNRGLADAPASVQADTARWRQRSDAIERFWAEVLVADPSACIAATDLTTVYNDWLVTAGALRQSDQTVTGRFSTHERTKSAGVEKRVVLNPAGLSRPNGQVGVSGFGLLTALPARLPVWLGVRFQVADDGTED